MLDKGGSRQPNLTRAQVKTVRQLTLSEARREVEAQMEVMRQKQQLEIMRKRQYDMEEQMRRFMQGGGNPNVPDQDLEYDENNDFDFDNYSGEDAL